MKQDRYADADNTRMTFQSARIAASLRALDQRQRTRARAAADSLLDCLRGFVDAGRVPLAAAVGEHTSPQTWRQYQSNQAGALDDRPGLLHYYYHAHTTPGSLAQEHGHFHLFAQLGADAQGINRYTHLVAIGVDARGLPLRLFTTNRWVTDETWLPADRLIALGEKIAQAQAPDDGPIERWLHAQLGVFAPQIAGLLRHRDRRMATRQRSGRRPGLLEDRRMHVISECLVSVEQQLNTFDRAIH